MEKDKGCCEGAENEINDNSKDCGCGSEETEDNTVKAEGDAGCGCGSIDIPDLSHVENPDNPKIIANEEFLKEFEDYAHSQGINSVGYTLLTPDLLIKDKFIQYPFTIVLTMEMGNEIIETPPGEDAKDLNDTAYVRLGILTTKLSDYLRKNGFATQIAHPYSGLVNFSPLAQKAGLGYIGQSGLLVTPELGPRQKISAIFVSIANLPISDENEHSWIPFYCQKCGKCIKACPEKALVEEETCCGSKIVLIQKQCIGCSQGCTYCIESCPFDEKGYEHVKNKFDKMISKLREKQNRKFELEPWEEWAKQNSNLFTGLKDGARIVVSMSENNEKIVLLEKENNYLNVNIKELKDINELEKLMADLLLIIDEKDMDDLLKDPNSVKFIDTISSGKIDIYGLMDHLKLKEKGYDAFFYRLGLNLGGGGCCG